jgi:hypothetical protein
MKKPFILPLLASSLLVACATPTPPVQDKPTVIGQQDIQRMAQQGQQRALNAREQQAEMPHDPLQPPVLAGAPPVPPPPAVAGGIRIPPQANAIHDKLKQSVSPENAKATVHGK